MSVIAEFSIPAEDFILGKAIQQTTGLSVEIEKMIPMETDIIPYFWVIGEGHSQFNAVLEREPELSKFEIVDELDDRELYRAEWDPSVDTFIQQVVKYDAILQEAEGNADAWMFQLRFPDSRRLPGFHTTCREEDISLTVEGVYNQIEPAASETRDLTEPQLDLVKRAYEEGYFDVPRKTTLTEISEKLDISDQAVNERLRRGLSTLIGSTLGPEVDRDT
jgi:predicted DNA binding protein